MGKKKRSSNSNQDTNSGQGRSWCMMSQVKPPEPFNFQEPSSWSSWIKRYKIFYNAVGLSAEAEEQQINMLLYCMGLEADDLLSSLGLPEEKRTSFGSVLSTFEDHFTTLDKVFYHRALFLESHQNPGEKVDSYLNNLNKLSQNSNWSCKNCKSTEFQNEMVLLKLITGFHDKRFSECLLRQENITLAEVLRQLKQFEAKSDKHISVNGMNDSASIMFSADANDRHPSKSLKISDSHGVLAAGVTKKYKISGIQTTSHNFAFQGMVASAVTANDENKLSKGGKLQEAITFTSGAKGRKCFNEDHQNCEYICNAKYNSPVDYTNEKKLPVHKQVQNNVKQTNEVQEDEKPSETTRNSQDDDNCSWSTIVGYSGRKTLAIPCKLDHDPYKLFDPPTINWGDSEDDVDEVELDDRDFLEYLRNCDPDSYKYFLSLLEKDSTEPTKTPSTGNYGNKTLENYHFSVSGHQSRRGLKNMCRQKTKSFSN